jgi:hypothetical protein
LAMNEPAVPVAPVRRIIAISPYVSLSSESGASEAQRPPGSMTFGTGKKSHGALRGAVVTRSTCLTDQPWSQSAAHRNSGADVADGSKARIPHGQSARTLLPRQRKFGGRTKDFRLGPGATVIAPQEAKDSADGPEDAAPEYGAGPTVTRSGDLWVLGHPTFVWGCMRTVVLRSAARRDGRAIRIHRSALQRAAGWAAFRHKNFAMGCGEMSEAQFTAFLETVFRLTSRVPQSA